MVDFVKVAAVVLVFTLGVSSLAWHVQAPMPLKVGRLQPNDILPVAVFLASNVAATMTSAEYKVASGDGAMHV